MPTCMHTYRRTTVLRDAIPWIAHDSCSFNAIPQTFAVKATQSVACVEVVRFFDFLGSFPFYTSSHDNEKTSAAQIGTKGRAVRR